MTIRATSLMVAAALLTVSGVAHAHGELQENRWFVLGGPAILAPASPGLDAVMDPSFGGGLEAGYLIGFGHDRGSGHFGLAPTVSLRLYDVNDEASGRGLTTATHVTTGVRAGFVGRGAFLYGLADVGLAGARYRPCGFERTCDTTVSETDPMTRIGGGVDFSVNRYLALGGSVAVPVIWSRDGRGIDETEGTLEAMAYGKFLFPAPGKKLKAEITMPSVDVKATPAD